MYVHTLYLLYVCIKSNKTISEKCKEMLGMKNT